MNRWYRVKPFRKRDWHAADRWSELEGGVTLCNKTFAALTALIRTGVDISMVGCTQCRTVLDNRAERAAREAKEAV